MLNPLDCLEKIALDNELVLDSRQFALHMDEHDELRKYRTHFEYPKMNQLPFVDVTKVDPDEDCLYLCGNSLGLMPKKVRQTMDQMFDKWATYGVYGHHFGDHPWYICDEELLVSMSRLVGASTDEIAIMNQLTSNLHFMLMSFYRPTKDRYKIVCEEKAFPSDFYAFESQIRLHGFSPESALLIVKPRQGEYTLRTEDILEVIKDEGQNIFLICFSGIHYFTGQSFDIAAITQAGHNIDAYVGWDLAHSIGNVELRLHDWQVDFAVWTTYKYLNAGAGNTGGAFLHSKYFSADLPYLTGWWGHSIDTRMEMTNVMVPGEGIRKYRMSTPSALHCAALRASLEIFDLLSMQQIRTKSKHIVAYFEYLLKRINHRLGIPVLQIITPDDVESRGSQLSIRFLLADVNVVHSLLKSFGVVCDHRKPDVLRMAATSLYNSYLDVYRTCHTLMMICEDLLSDVSRND